MISYLLNLISKKATLTSQIGVNHTNFEHAFFAAVMQIVIGLVFGNWFAGGCFGVAFFLGREHAQYQHTIGYTIKSSFQAFAVWKWKLDAQLDLLFPIIACSVIYGISRLTD
jgi:hypothetical protein